MSAVGRRIRAARLSLGWTQRALAERCGLTQPAIAGWETEHEYGHTPSVANLIRVAGVLGVSVSFLVGDVQGTAKP